VSGLTKEELTLLVENPENRSDLDSFKAPVDASQASSQQVIQTCLESVARLDHNRLENSLNRAAVEFTRPVLLEEVVVPLLRKIGDLWLEGQMKIVHEHMATCIVRSLIWDMLRSTIPPDDAPAIFIATPAGQWHELGALMIAVAAADMGWKVAYFGPNLPAEEIAAAADQLSVSLIGLSIMYQSEEYSLVNELQKLRRFLSQNIGILLGGPLTVMMQKLADTIGAQQIDSIRQFKQALSVAKPMA
jgi:methanogenic corrinoid protein MtbC1